MQDSLAAALQWLADGVRAGPRARRLAGGLSMAVQFRTQEISKATFFSVEGPKLCYGHGLHPKPSVTLEGPDEEMARVVRGEIDVTTALSRGTVQVTGNYYHAIDVSRLAAAVRSVGRP